MHNMLYIFLKKVNFKLKIELSKNSKNWDGISNQEFTLELIWFIIILREQNIRTLQKNRTSKLFFKRLLNKQIMQSDKVGSFKATAMVIALIK